MQRLALAGLLPALVVASADPSRSAASTASPIVTEAELLAVLDHRHPAVVERLEALRSAQAAELAAATLENPVLEVVREDPDGPTAEVDWALSWQLPGSDRRLQVNRERQAVAAAEARLEIDLERLRRDLRRLYADWAVATARRERLARHVDRVDALAAREQARAERGESSGIEARRLTLAAAVLRGRLSVVAAEAAAGRLRARAWLPQLAEDAEPELPALPEVASLPSDPATVQAAEAELAAASLARRAAARFIPSPTLTVGWQRQELGNESAAGPILGLAWSLPLFARNQAARRLAQARVEAASARLETARRQLEAERAAALATYLNLRTAVTEAETAVAGNDRLLAGTEAAFRLGEINLADLLETLRGLAESESTLLDLYQHALSAHRELELLAAPARRRDGSETGKEPGS